MTSIPKRVDPRRTDVNAFVSRAVADADMHDQQDLIIEMLLDSRALSTLRSLSGVLPKRPGMKYDRASLGNRARRRIQQAFSAAGYRETQQASDAIVVEIGCGRAENAKHVLECGARRYIGVDPNTSLAPATLMDTPGVEIVNGTAEDLPFSNDSVDFAVSFNVLEHIPDPHAALHEIARVLRPGGSFFTVFGPPFNAATGPHLTRYIDLPYVHHLFPEHVVGEFTGRENPYCTVNRRPLSYYRDVFLFESVLKTTLYHEHVNGRGFWLLKEKEQLEIDLPWDELGVCAITMFATKS